MADKEMYFHCDHCGVLCRQSATYCNNCGASFVKVEGDGVKLELDNELEEGVSYSEARTFIDKNPDRFISVFQKNKGKKWFVSLNLPALFLTPFWILYRKMYKNFALYIGGSFVSVIISMLIVYLCTFSMRNEIADLLLYLMEQLDTVDINSIDIYSLAGTDLLRDLYKYNNMVEQLTVIYLLWIYVAGVLYNVAFSLISDCLYRGFVVNGVKCRKDGGVSWTGVMIYIAASFVCNLILKIF